MYGGGWEEKDEKRGWICKKKIKGRKTKGVRVSLYFCIFFPFSMSKSNETSYRTLEEEVFIFFMKEFYLGSFLLLTRKKKRKKKWSPIWVHVHDCTTCHLEGTGIMSKMYPKPSPVLPGHHDQCRQQKPFSFTRWKKLLGKCFLIGKTLCHWATDDRVSVDASFAEMKKSPPNTKMFPTLVQAVTRSK